MALWGVQLSPAQWYALVVAWLFVESTGFPISDEPIVLSVGYGASVGQLDFALVVLLALLGKVAASCLAYGLGTSYRWRDSLDPA